jgi:hypothetical protein
VHLTPHVTIRYVDVYLLAATAPELEIGPRILISNIDYAVRSGTKLRTTAGGTRMLGVTREKFVKVSPKGDSHLVKETLRHSRSIRFICVFPPLLSGDPGTADNLALLLLRDS